jgi:hypothetical protein
LPNDFGNIGIVLVFIALLSDEITIGDMEAIVAKFQAYQKPLQRTTCRWPLSPGASNVPSCWSQ